MTAYNISGEDILVDIFPCFLTENFQISVYAFPPASAL